MGQLLPSSTFSFWVHVPRPPCAKLLCARRSGPTTSQHWKKLAWAPGGNTARLLQACALEPHPGRGGGVEWAQAGPEGSRAAWPHPQCPLKRPQPFPCRGGRSRKKSPITSKAVGTSWGGGRGPEGVGSLLWEPGPGGLTVRGGVSGCRCLGMDALVPTCRGRWPPPMVSLDTQRARHVVTKMTVQKSRPSEPSLWGGERRR